MKFYLDNTFQPLAEDATEEVIKARIEGAYTLAAGTKPMTAAQDSNAISSGTGIVPKSIDTSGKLSASGQELAKQFGITSEELNDNKLI